MSNASTPKNGAAPQAPAPQVGAGALLIVQGVSVQMSDDCWRKLSLVLDTPTGDNLKREILTKMFPQLFGPHATLASFRPSAPQTEAGGDGLSSATCGHTAIEGGKDPVRPRRKREEPEPLLVDSPPEPLPPEERCDLGFGPAPGMAAGEEITIDDLANHPRAGVIPGYDGVRLPLTAVAQFGPTLVTVVARINRLGIDPAEIPGKPGRFITLVDAMRILNYTKNGGGMEPPKHHKKGD